MEKGDWYDLPSATRQRLMEAWVEAYTPAFGHSNQCSCSECHIVMTGPDGLMIRRRLPTVTRKEGFVKLGKDVDAIIAATNAAEIDRRAWERGTQAMWLHEPSKQPWAQSVGPVGDKRREMEARKEVREQEVREQKALDACVVAGDEVAIHFAARNRKLRFLYASIGLLLLVGAVLALFGGPLFVLAVPFWAMIISLRTTMNADDALDAAKLRQVEARATYSDAVERIR